MTFRFASMITSSSAEVLGFKIYGGKAPKIIKWIHKGLLKGNALLYWYRYRFVRKHKYHLVDTGLGYGYHDGSDRLLYAVMKIVCDHIEVGHDGIEEYEKFTIELKENSFDWGPTGCTDREVSIREETATIYKWWTQQRPADHDRLHDWTMTLYDKSEIKTNPIEYNGQILHEYIPPTDDELDVSMGTREECWDFEEQLIKTDQEMLHRVIDIRQSLWT